MLKLLRENFGAPLRPRSHRTRRCSQMFHAKNGTYCCLLECSHSIAGKIKGFALCMPTCLRVLCELGPGPATPKTHSRSRFFLGISQNRARHCGVAMHNAVGVATTLELRIYQCKPFALLRRERTQYGQGFNPLELHMRFLGLSPPH